jgi:N-acetylmuramoyl-L-alanine amidase
MGANDPAENRTLLISKMAGLFHVKGKSQGSPLTESNERRQVPFRRLKKGTVLFMTKTLACTEWRRSRLFCAVFIITIAILMLQTYMGKAEEKNDAALLMPTLSPATESSAPIANPGPEEKDVAEYEDIILDPKEDDMFKLRRPYKNVRATPTPVLGVTDLWVVSRGMSVAMQDIDLLERLVMAEAGAEPYEGQIAVVNVVINRMMSDEFRESTIQEVVFAKGQFSPVGNGHIWKVTPSESCKRAVREALNGRWVIDKDVLFFLSTRARSYAYAAKHREFAVQIGDHLFYR